MDLQWLLPEQIEQILKFCELSSVEDLTVAANILESNHWNLESAMHDVVSQNDEINKQEARKNAKLQRPELLKPETEEIIHHNEHGDYDEEGPFEIESAEYHQIDSINGSAKVNGIANASILAQQNFEYEQMQRKMKDKRQDEERQQEYARMREEEFREGQKEFEGRVLSDPMTIKFRLAHKVAQFEFSREEKIETVFRYVSSCLREGFENRYGEFDLTQSFPRLSLTQRKGETLREVFQGSEGEVLIVKEL